MDLGLKKLSIIPKSALPNPQFFLFLPLLKIEHYISELLFEHDCVIVPNFGGFVANYAPAKVHPVQHVFSPPYKNISFNKHLKNNDGLLANYIVQKAGKTFDEANRIISVFVDESNNVLKQGNKILLEKLGTIYNDLERNVQFDPDKSANFLIESFGLSTFQSLPVKRDAINKPIVEFIDKPPIAQERKRKKAGAYIVTGVAIAAIALLIWLPLKTDVLKDVNYSNLNPFAEKVLPLYVERTDAMKEIKVEDFKVAGKLSVINDAVAVTEIAFVDNSNSKLIVRLQEEVKVRADKTQVNNSFIKNTSEKFHVVSGCFRIQSNAKNYLAQLRAKNIDANIIGKNKDGLYVVSCGDFRTSDDAYRELERIRGLNVQAWMMER